MVPSLSSIQVLQDIKIQQPLTNLAYRLWSQIDPRTVSQATEAIPVQQPDCLFLLLPRELRDHILDFVLFTPNLPLSEAEQQSREEVHDVTLSAWHDGKHVLYPPLIRPSTSSETPPTLSTKHIASFSLLQTCHQIRTETLDALRRPRTRSVYVLSIDIHDAGWGNLSMQPTWDHVPFLTRCVDEVHATVCVRSGPGPSISNAEQSSDTTPTRQRRNGTRSAFTVGNGGPPLVIWTFYGVLERFLRVGPFYADPSLATLPPRIRREFNRGLAIKKLVVNFVTPPHLPPNSDYLPEGYTFEGFPLAPGPHHQQQGLKPLYDELGKHLVPPASHAADVLKDGIDTILAGYPIEFGRILYERMDDLVLLVDGKEVFSWDIASRLETLRPAYPKSHFKDAARAVRKERGLRTGE